MKCLFVRAPFAGWIVDGVKTIEYRTRPTNIRGRIGIIQSRSGTVIGSAEITGCEWNEELEHYEWKLANAARFAEPFPFPPKNGAVIWIDAEVPENRPTAPKLTAAELRKQKKEYEKAIDEFLHPIAEEDVVRFWAVMKDGRELPFEDEAEFQKFLKAHKKEIADAQVEVREK